MRNDPITKVEMNPPDLMGGGAAFVVRVTTARQGGFDGNEAIDGTHIVYFGDDEAEARSVYDKARKAVESGNAE